MHTKLEPQYGAKAETLLHDFQVGMQAQEVLQLWDRRTVGQV